MSNRHEVLGYQITAIRMPEMVSLCEEAIDERRPLQIGVVNAAKIVHGRRNPALRDAVRDCDVVLADGQSVVWASRLLGAALPERITGIDLFTRLLELADRRAHRVFLLGASAEVVAETAARTSKDYAGLSIVGFRDGYFSGAEAEDVARQVRDARPDMLFLGMSSPKKELFLARYRALMGVPIMHGVGGAFDIVAGVTHRAPSAWQRVGMEWAYRLIQEPGRMWKRYLYTNTAFVWLVARAWVAQRGATKGASA